MTTKRNKQKNHGKQKDYFASFKEASASHFNFLVTEYDFECVSSKSYAMECVIKYRNDTTGVTISYELGSATWVVLSRLINKGDETVEGESYGLHLLTRMRCPSMLIKHEANARTEPDKYLETALTGHAEILRKCAADVLKGNFEVFEELKSVAEAERRRINKELFGSETGETV